MEKMNDSELPVDTENSQVSPAAEKRLVMRRWFFFYEGEEDGWTFYVEAKDHEEALQVAYDDYGPQVCSMYYREVSNGT